MLRAGECEEQGGSDAEGDGEGGHAEDEGAVA